MNRLKFTARASAFLMAVLMFVSILPVAHAADDSKCATCGTACTKIVLKQANCHENGVVEYICANSKCAAYQQAVLVKTDIDPTNHDTICIDNGDGITHTAHCRYHADYKNIKENHTFVNGYCTKCAAADYSEAEIIVKSDLEVYVDLNDTTATLSAGKVSIMVGNVDITKNYVISYSWVDSSGTVVCTDESYRLPASIVKESGDYTYGCFVMAMPRSGIVGKYITASCTVKVFVRDMLSVNAMVGSKQAAFRMDQTNGATPESVLQQVYQEIYEAAKIAPSHVVFGEKPNSEIGDLLVNNGTAYYFSGNSSARKLGDVTFVPADAGAGTYSIPFTAYDIKGNTYPGILTIVVEQELGTPDVAYYGRQGDMIPFSSADFASYWQTLYPGGALKTVFFTKLPAITEGTLFYNYNPYATTHTPVKESDLFFTVLSSATTYLIDGVTFVPTTKFTGQVDIPFEIYGQRSDGFQVQASGTVSIFISSGAVKNVTYSVKPSEKLTLSASDFLAAYATSTGTTKGNFSIRLLDVPAHGALYVGYTGTVRDIALSAADISDYTFYYSSELGREIGDLTYIAPKTDKDITDAVRYLVCNEKGEFVYIGELSISVKKPAPVYTVSFPDVKPTDWFYTYVMDLAQAGIINGIPEIVNGVTVNYYKPNNPNDPNDKTCQVTYAQALKLIMLAVGYEEQAPTGEHWASGYLAKAQADALISTVLTETRLDEQISRNMIAQIAARAMNLPKSTRTESPLKDVDMNGVYTPYILSLYDAEIITGDNNGMFNGTDKITRAEMATIVWRIMNYQD